MTGLERVSFWRLSCLDLEALAKFALAVSLLPMSSWLVSLWLMSLFDLSAGLLLLLLARFWRLGTNTHPPIVFVLTCFIISCQLCGVLPVTVFPMFSYPFLLPLRILLPSWTTVTTKRDGMIMMTLHCTGFGKSFALAHTSLTLSKYGYGRMGLFVY